MTGTIRLRRAQAADLEGIAQVHHEAWCAAHAGLLPADLVAARDLPVRQAFWQAFFASAEGSPSILVAEAGAGPEGGGEATIVGFVWWRRLPEPNPRWDAEVIALYVRPGRQGRGIGRRLMAAAAEVLVAAGARSLYLWVYGANQPARGFYQALAGRMVDEDIERFADLEVPIVAYLWQPLDDLLRASGRDWTP